MEAGKEKDWVIEIEKEVEIVRGRRPEAEEDAKLWRKRCIYRVPSYIASLKCNAHKPKIVSFGPFHHDDEELKPMEEHKTRALHRFLARANKKVKDYVKALEEVVQDLMHCYDQLDEKWKNKEKFLQLMLRDGCFMLEILYKKFGDYSDNDPIFSKHGILHKMPHIRRDMLMIENQIPLLALQTIAAVGRDETEVPITFACSSHGEQVDKESSLYNLIVDFCNPSGNSNIKDGGLHVLDLVRKSMLDTCEGERQIEECCSSIIRSATELADAGIHFKRSKTVSLKDITFKEFRETLTLPPITVDDSTKFTFLNLMAFEQLHEGAGSEVTSYVFFMDNLIDTPKDVNLLRSKGIINNALGSDDEVAKLFNEISTDMTLDPSYSLSQIHLKLYNHCRSCWKKSKANLKQTYFRSPWASISLGAAGLLLFLSLAQTTFAILAYFKPPKSR